ncbi:hypothetical protein A2V82_16605 [candidate division KSB1 bacterium RBG_16_48_16]|nr:MAG: hypothetical protein A2V82_16605 [candidate division KSB1 bacterium RBG_16_48_16]
MFINKWREVSRFLKMNLQKRSEIRSIALHREIVKKLKNNPKLWDIPQKNIEKWKKQRGRLVPAFIEWENILENNKKEQILFILESDSEEAVRLRSSSPFTGILTESERKRIFESFSIKRSLTS